MFNISSPKLKVALFDVDDTLLAFNSMHSYINYFFVNYYGQEIGLKKIESYNSEINTRYNHCTRAFLNQLYYSNYEGVSKAILEILSERWFSQFILNNPHAFNKIVLQKLKVHQKNNYKIIVVSGGFFASLDLLIKHLKIDHCFYIYPEIINGVLTGQIKGLQTIGEGKAIALKNYFKNEEIDWENSYAYGDHISDLAMLRLVGNPVAVGNNQDLLEIAKANNWNIIN